MAAVGGGDGIAPIDGEDPTGALASRFLPSIDASRVVSWHMLGWVAATALVISSFPLACAGALLLISSTFSQVGSFWFASFIFLCGFALVGDALAGLLSLFFFNT